MNWYIGQDIVAIKDHDQGGFKMGDEFKIKGLSSSFCKCNYILIDIGVNPLVNHSNYSRCSNCDSRIYTANIWWFSERKFAPLEPMREAISELIKESLTVKIEQK